MGKPLRKRRTVGIDTGPTVSIAGETPQDFNRSMALFAKVVLAAALLVLGLLMCAFGGLVLVSIPVSDTATGTLIVFGLEFVVPGLAMAGIGAWLLRRVHRATRPKPG